MHVLPGYTLLGSGLGLTLEMSFKVYFVEIQYLNEIAKEINKRKRFCLFETYVKTFLEVGPKRKGDSFFRWYMCKWVGVSGGLEMPPVSGKGL